MFIHLGGYVLLLRFQQLLLISKASKTISIFEKLFFGRYIAAGWQDNDFRVKVDFHPG